MWLACKAIFGGSPAHARSVAECFVKQRPTAAAAVGILAIMARTPFSVELVACCPEFTDAALWHQEPFFGRSGAELIVDSTVGTSELFDTRIADSVMKWINGMYCSLKPFVAYDRHLETPFGG